MLLLAYLANVRMGGGGNPVPFVPPHITWGSFSRLSDRFRGRIPKRVCEIIDEVVEPVILPQVAVKDGKAESYYRKIVAQQLHRRELALRAELKAEGIAWRKMYAEALVEQWRKKNEEEAILVILMSA